MINKEAECRKAFYSMKRQSKSPLTPSYTRGYSAGLGDREPARKTYDYILLLGENTSINFEEKLSELYTFLENANEEERIKPMMGTSFYYNLQAYIRSSLRNIEKGEPVITSRL